MKKTRFVIPFPGAVGNRRAFRQRFRPGVYIVKKGNDILYIGFSGSDVIRTMYRHFYNWGDEQLRIVFNQEDKNIKVRVIYTNTPGQAAKLESALLKKYKTKYNYQVPTGTQTQTDLNILGSYFSAKEVTEF